MFSTSYGIGVVHFKKKLMQTNTNNPGNDENFITQMRAERSSASTSRSTLNFAAEDEDDNESSLIFDADTYENPGDEDDLEDEDESDDEDEGDDEVDDTDDAVEVDETPVLDEEDLEENDLDEDEVDDIEWEEKK